MRIGETITAPVSGGLSRVREHLAGLARLEGAGVSEISAHFFGRRGKLLRPTVHLLSAASQGDVSPHHITLASISELVHASSLIHDDVVDGAVVRRHEANLRTRWSNKISVLFGDLIFTEAFKQVLRIGQPELAGMLVDTIHAMVEGELVQALEAWSAERSEESYYRCIRGKTAELFRFAAETALVASGIDGSARSAAAAYGENLGMAYQILDDITDLVSTPAEAGKDTLLDLRRGIFTLPVILYFREAGPPETKTLVEMARNGCERDDLLDRLTSRSALSDSIAAAGRFLDAAREALEAGTSSSARDSLRLLADSVGDSLRRAAAVA